VPYQLVSAVAADVVVRLDGPVPGLDDDHRGALAGRRQFSGEVASGAWQAIDAPDIEPSLLEDRLALGFEKRGIDRVGVVDRRGPQFWIVLCTASGGWLRKWATLTFLIRPAWLS